jgi:translation initiation factor 2 subunit 2
MSEITYYDYEFMLNKLMFELQDNNPELVNRNKLIIVLPKILRINFKKIIWINFNEICNILQRPQEHIINYLTNEFKTSCSINSNYQLIVNGKFNQTHIESLLRSYIKKYVICNNCKSLNTIFNKNNNLNSIICQLCLSSRYY